MPPDVLTGVITREGIAEKPDGWGVDQAEFNSFAEDAPIPTGLGKGEKTVLLFVLLSLVVAACIPKQAPPGVDLSPSGEDDNSDLSPLLCAQLVNMANLHSVDVAVADQAWQSALTDTKPLQAQLDCFMPEKGPAVPTLTVAGIAPGGPEPGDEIVQLALASPDGVQPLLAVPLGSVDENSDGVTDYRLVKFFSPKPGGWQSLGVDQAQTVLPEAYIDSYTGQIGLEAGAATVTATRRPDGSMSFSLQSGGGQPLVLSEEQLRPLTAAASLLDQAEAFLEGQKQLTLDQVPGVDLGMKGPKYGLPEAVFAELQGRGGAPIVLQGGLAGAKSGSECELALPDHLVTGETINQATDGRAQYLDFNGAVATEGLWRLPAADDVYCVAFVAKDNNQWGLASGTVALWLYRDGGKAGTEILNPDSPVQLLWESPNQGQLVMTDDGFKLVVTSPDGVVLRDQEVKFGPAMFPWAEREFDSIEEASGAVRDACGWQVYQSFPAPVMMDFLIEAKEYLESNVPDIKPGRGLPGNFTSLENSNGERCIYYIAAVDESREYGFVVFKGEDNKFHIFSFPVPKGGPKGYFPMRLP